MRRQWRQDVGVGAFQRGCRCGLAGASGKPPDTGAGRASESISRAFRGRLPASLAGHMFWSWPGRWVREGLREFSLPPCQAQHSEVGLRTQPALGVPPGEKHRFALFLRGSPTGRPRWRPIARQCASAARPSLMVTLCYWLVVSGYWSVVSGWPAGARFPGVLACGWGSTGQWMVSTDQ